MAHWSDKLVNSPGFCTRPFFHTYLARGNNVHVCCYNLSHSHGDIEKSSFNEVISKNNKTLIDFRKQFIDSDQLPESCSLCRDPVMNQYRTSHIERTQHILKKFNSVDELIHNEEIYTYDTRFNNLCNLKCNYCRPESSSRLASETTKSSRIVYSIGNDNIKQILERFEDSIENVVEFYFAGGEPLIMKEHYDILDICLKHKRYDIILSYSTNLTNIGSAKYNLIEYWQQFKDVRAAASIDAGWEQIEFIREGTNWNQLVDNFRKIRHLPGVTVTVAPVMAMWNMLAFPKAYRYLVDNNLIKFQPAGSDMGGEILDHEYLKPGVLPQHIKDHIKNTYYTEYRDYPELQILLRYLDQDLTHLLPKTKRYIDRLCKQTNSNFELLFPELKGIFDNVQ